MIVLETPRLVLRRLRAEDLDDLHAIYSDAEVRRYFPEGVLSRSATREELDWFLDGHPDDPRLGLWATIHRETGAFIGRCGLLPWEIEGRKEVEVAYLVARAWWRQGLGGETASAIVRHGFDRLGLSRVIALIHPENAASMATARKAGLAFERVAQLDDGPAHMFAAARATRPHASG